MNTKQVAGVARISPLLQGPDFSTIYIKKGSPPHDRPRVRGDALEPGGHRPPGSIATTNGS